MIKAFLRTAALIILCLLLTYAPEILTAVSGPYPQSTQARVLLRIALSSQDEKTVSSLYKTLSAYQKAYPAVHLRVTRVDVQQLSSLSDPLPDVYLVSETPSFTDSSPVYSYQPQEGAALFCCVSSHSLAPQTAQQFIAYLCEASMPSAAPSQI